MVLEDIVVMLFMKDNTRMVQRMGLGERYGKMVLIMLDSSKMAQGMGKGRRLIKME